MPRLYYRHPVGSSRVAGFRLSVGAGMSGFLPYIGAPASLQNRLGVIGIARR